MSDEVKIVLRYLDAEGGETTPDKAVRLERITLSPQGSVLQIEYFVAARPQPPREK